MHAILRMTRFTTVAIAVAAWVCIVVLACGALGVGASAASASANFCVGSQHGCFTTIQAAITAAADGDTINVAPGTYSGPITIVKSIRLTGASAAATIIRGGGPVVTIGQFEGSNDALQVAISRVTITDGINDNLGFAAGGGVWIPQSAGQTTGASVTIDDSVISDNQAVPSATFSDTNPGPCGVPQNECAFASGGGISNSGRLSVTNTRVVDNVAGSPGVTHRAEGGGITNGPPGTLSISDSVLSGNRAAVSPPDGRYTEGGGIEDIGTMTIENSRITGNTSTVVSVVPSSILANDFEQNADAGGIDLSTSGSATIANSTIDRNTAADFDSNGDAQAFNGGIDNDGVVMLSGSTVDRNSVSARVPDGSGLVAAASAGALGLTGTATVRSSHLGGNTLSAISTSGLVFVGGAGIQDTSGELTVERTLIIGNTGTASAGILSLAIGGGILETALGGPDPRLTLTDSVVTANKLTGTPDPAQGGGIFNGGILGGGPYPITITHTIIQANSPDQCVGNC